MELGKASAKKIDDLLKLLNSIDVQNEAALEPMIRFRDQYRAILLEKRPWFFEAVIRKLEISKQEIEKKLRLVLADEGKDSIQWRRGLSGLRQKIGSPRIRIFRNFLNISGGLKFLLDLRADMIAAQRQHPVNLEPLDLDIAQLFDLWFQGGFLFLNEITLDSPYRQIRFLKEHENHFNHKKSPDTAIFYSINNTQNGLSGLGLGKVLIFQVVEILEKNYPGIKTFATLSPIPGFWERYFKPVLQGEKDSFQMNRDRLTELFPEKIRQPLFEIHYRKSGKKVTDLGSLLLEIFSDLRWIEDPEYLRILKKPLTDLVYFYLSPEKDRRGKTLHPLANFHLGHVGT